jgi:hypothetical protein
MSNYDYKFRAGYTKLGTATAPSAAPTINILDATGGTLVLTAGTPTSYAAMVGAYSYTYTGVSGMNLIGLFHTTDTSMDQQDLFCVDVEITATGGGTAGSGAVTWAVTVNDGTSPLDGVEVWVTTDSAGSNVVASGSTDALGLVTFYLDAGTYYFWKQLSGYNFTNPESGVVA